MRGLKSLVIGMGLLIILGLTVVIVTVVKRSGDTKVADGMNSLAKVAVPVETGFGEKNIIIPKDATVLETILDNNRLVLRLKLSNKRQALLLINSFNGQRLGLIRLDPR
tara:strand:- start:279 stop:605 length:327 start_codon:yes stop_codon:yes gene_type:complete